MKVNMLTPIRSGGPFKWGEDLVSLLNKNGIQARHIHTLFDLSASCLHQDADIVHTAVPIPFKLWKKPIVFTIHGDYTIEKNIWQRFTPKTITQAAVITTPSQYLKQKLGLNNAIVIPNAIFPGRFNQVRHTEKDIINLVTITKFHFEDKARGILDILEILSAAKKIANKRIKYVVVGGGPYLGQIMAQAKSYGVDVEFTDMLQAPKKILEKSDIFIYYSHHDNFPIVILEAMASGLPVLTNSVGAVSEIIDNGQNGYIAESDDVYLEYLINLISSPDLRVEVGKNARQSIEANFDWSRIIDRYIEIYKAIL